MVLAQRKGHEREAKHGKNFATIHQLAQKLLFNFAVVTRIGNMFYTTVKA